MIFAQLEIKKVIAEYLKKNPSIITMETITIPKTEYETLKKKAELDEDLLIQLIRGLEDIKEGRINPWKSKFTN